jgi:proteasome lid subunit RPN8/RPN11
MTSAGRVVLPPAVRRAIVAHARDAQPAECCGVLVGRGRRVAFAVRMRNVAASPTRYRLDDRAHIDLRKTLRAFRPPLAIVGVYHSHPEGRPDPSPTDLAEAHYPEWVHVIVGGGRQLRAFRIVGGRARRLLLR